MCTVLLPPGVNPIAVNKYIVNRRPDDDPIRVETCSLLLSTIKIDVFDALFILLFCYYCNASGCTRVGTLIVAATADRSTVQYLIYI